MSAEKAIIALQKVQASTNSCGCIDANNKTYDALDEFDKAMSKSTFEKARIFIQRGRQMAQEVIIALDICGENSDSEEPALVEDDLMAQEQQLIAQQQQLLEQQKELEEKLKQQKEQQAEILAQKEAVFAIQQQLKLNAETSLKDFETLVMSFSEALGCKKPIDIVETSYTKNTTELKDESLEDTKVFYTDKARNMAQSLIASLDNCEDE